MNTPDDLVRRAYSRLRAVRDSVAAQTNVRVDDRFGAEFATALDELERAGYDVATFRIPPEEFTVYSYQTNYVTMARHYDARPSVERQYFLMKIDAALGYFEMASEDPPRKIGFRQPPE